SERMVLAAKSKLKDAEKIKQIIAKNGLFDYQYNVLKKGQHIYFPVREKIKGIETVDIALEKKQKKITEKESGILPSSYDIIGDIAIVEIRKGDEKNEKKVAEALLKLHKNIKVVARKAGEHAGEFRTRKLKILAGENRKETIYRESGASIKLDVEKVYFSERLGTERLRIAKQIKKGENVLVMFSGCAPYPLVFSRNSKANLIFGIEKNPAAHKYALENVKINHADNVRLFCGDVNELMPLKRAGVKSRWDEKQLDEKLKLEPKPEIIEFFLRAGDLENHFDKINKAVKKLKDFKIMIHQPAPDLYKGKTFSLSSLKMEENENAIECYRKIAEICKKHKNVIGYVAHAYAWRSDPKKNDQMRLMENLFNVKSEYLFIENHVHGMHADADKIVKALKQVGLKQCTVDISHLYLNYKNSKKVLDAIKKIKKVCKVYFHVNDSDGKRDSLEIGKGKIDFGKIIGEVEFGVLEIRSRNEEKPVELIRSYKNSLIDWQFDRIVMPLPKSAEDFLETAMLNAKKGTIIHFYDFVHENDFPHKSIEKIKRHAGKFKVLKAVKCGQYSPGKYRVCVDFKVI
ncbi:hypothetical protein KY311_00055, partial [Candidatus Woesearchaeota archaeon]|nr:hypothetical protein [Candidatus Woesearchaeota archaeon]